MRSDVFGAFREWLVRLKGTARPGRSELDLKDELAHHMELVEEELRRRGYPQDEARRRARIQAGHETQTMEVLRQQRGVPSLSTFWLDAKLGLRMLRKHWGLTLAGGLAMAAAIGVGTTVFDVMYTLSGTQLPLEDGDRIVVIQPWDRATRKEQYSSTEDFLRWRDQLQSVEDVAAFASAERNLITEDGQSAPALVAQMSAAGFRVAGVNPLLGRFLASEDDRNGAATVAVISHDVWRSRFNSDPGVTGRRLQIGEGFYTIVGVMPEDFAFPVNHDVWIPLRADSPPARQLLAEPLWGYSGGNFALTVFGRLAPGVSIEGAQAEVAARGLLVAGSLDTGRALEPRVVPYATGITGNTDAWMLRILGYLLALLLVPPCVNIAVLMYARIVARSPEFAARLALGASRARIVSQIFIEALVLALAAAGLGLLLASRAVVLFQSSQEQWFGHALPFWMNFDISPGTMLYACGLAVLAALIAGGIPAVRATRRWRQSGLHALGNRTSLSLGKVWIAIVVLQVGLSVATLPTVFEAAWWTAQSGWPGPGFEPGQYLTAVLVIDRETPSSSGIAGDGRSPLDRFAAVRAELVRQLEAEPGVSAVALSTALPGGETIRPIEGVDRHFASGRMVETVNFNRIDEAFFDTYRMKLLAGRRLEPGDLVAGARAVVVNRSFAMRLLGSEAPLGARFRIVDTTADHVEAPGWLVVGVVDDSFDNRATMTFYRPLPEIPDSRVLSLSLRADVTGTAGSGISHLTRRLREIAATVDPTMRVIQPRTLADIYEGRRTEEYMNSSVMVGLALGVILFSVAGIYTILSFTVVQRRQEIGIRAALGAPPMFLVAGIFRRAMLPVVAGVVAGSLAALGIEYYLSDILFETIKQGRQFWILPAAEIFILVVGLIAVAGPARRALEVSPVAALRDG